MTNDQKDAICQLWIEIFGTQEGAGYNCPQGAYDFAEAVMAYTREECAKVCDARTAEPGWCCADAIRARGEK